MIDYSCNASTMDVEKLCLNEVVMASTSAKSTSSCARSRRRSPVLLTTATTGATMAKDELEMCFAEMDSK
jgi:hypothetical protein